MTQLPVINAFWAGPRMGKLHAACLQSFVRQGHRTVLHVYETPEDTPRGVELADASKIMSRDRVIAHKRTGSLALASDIFRFELQAIEAGIYVDCDCYCVRPLDDADYVFGWQDNETINAAVLKIPADCPALASMRAISSTPGFIPPWGKVRSQLYYRMRSALGIPVPLEKMSWGTVGPKAFTFYAKDQGISDKAQEKEVFYPLSHSQTDRLLEADVSIDDLITPKSRVIHLWNEMLRRKERARFPGTALDSIIKSLDA